MELAGYSCAVAIAKVYILRSLAKCVLHYNTTHNIFFLKISSSEKIKHYLQNGMSSLGSVFIV